MATPAYDTATDLGRARRIARVVRHLRASMAPGVEDHREPNAHKVERWQRLEVPELPDWAHELRDHDPAWSLRYVSEAERIRGALGGEAFDVQHIGSSAIPGLRSKPVLDVVVTAAGPPDSPGLISAFAELGYRYCGTSPCDRAAAWYWSRPTPPVLFVAHLCELGNPWPRIATDFRDYLRENPEERSLYQRRKEGLAALPGVTLLEYSLGKLALFYEISGRAAAWRSAAPTAGP